MNTLLAELLPRPDVAVSLAAVFLFAAVGAWFVWQLRNRTRVYRIEGTDVVRALLRSDPARRFTNVDVTAARRSGLPEGAPAWCPAVTDAARACSDVSEAVGGRAVGEKDGAR